MASKVVEKPKKRAKKARTTPKSKKVSKPEQDPRDPLEPRPDDIYADKIPDVADALGVGARQISVWFSLGLPRPMPGERYNVSATRRWREEYERNDPAKKKQRAEEAYREVKTQRELLKLKQERGELVEIAAVEECLEQRARIIRRGFENIADSVPQAFPEIRVALTTKLRKEFDRLMSAWSAIEPQEVELSEEAVE